MQRPTLQNFLQQYVIGNCDIDIFIFRHRFQMRPKFAKFKRDWNATEKFWIYINEVKIYENFTKVDEFVIYYPEIS
jgi:hypothetical protein